MAEMLQNGAEWVWNNRAALLEMGLGPTLIAGGEMIKRGGQFFGITIAAGGSIGTAGLGSPAAVGAGITIGVSATTVGNTIQATGAVLMIEGSKNLKGNDKSKSRKDHEGKSYNRVRQKIEKKLGRRLDKKDQEAWYREIQKMSKQKASIEEANPSLTDEELMEAAEYVFNLE